VVSSILMMTETARRLKKPYFKFAKNGGFLSKRVFS